MGVDVDEAGADDHAAGVELMFCIVGVDVFGNFDDTVVFYCEVEGIVVVGAGVDEVGVFDEEGVGLCFRDGSHEKQEG